MARCIGLRGHDYKDLAFTRNGWGATGGGSEVRVIMT